MGDLISQPEYLVCGEEDHLLPPAADDPDTVGRIPAYGVAAQRRAQHEAQDLPGLTHRPRRMARGQELIDELLAFPVGNRGMAM
jgi:hypothetical protein